MEDVRTIKRFMFAGKAFFRIVDKGHDRNFIYKVVKIPEQKIIYKGIELWFVSLYDNTYAGTGDWRAYKNIGTLKKNTLIFNYSKKSKFSVDHPAVILFSRFLNNISINCLTEYMEFSHIGKCGVCCRKLTTPEAIESGYGKDCIDSVI